MMGPSQYNPQGFMPQQGQCHGQQAQGQMMQPQGQMGMQPQWGQPDGCGGGGMNG